MHNWKSIRLEIAQSAEFPTGSVSRAYIVRLPLDDRDLVDEDALVKTPVWRRYGAIGRLTPTKPDLSKRSTAASP